MELASVRIKLEPETGDIDVLYIQKNDTCPYKSEEIAFTTVKDEREISDGRRYVEKPRLDINRSGVGIVKEEPRIAEESKCILYADKSKEPCSLKVKVEPLENDVEDNIICSEKDAPESRVARIKDEPDSGDELDVSRIPVKEEAWNDEESRFLRTGEGAPRPHGSEQPGVAGVKAELDDSTEQDGERTRSFASVFTEIDVEDSDIKNICLKSSGNSESSSASGKCRNKSSISRNKSDLPVKYNCPMCAYTCYQKSSLKLHALTHSGEKPFTCSQCGFSCSERGNLKRHMRTHSGEKPFSCPECSYKCVQKVSMDRHALTHTGEKSLSCAECDYTCSRKEYLASHRLTHSGVKRFACRLCAYKSLRKSSLKRHFKISHPGEEQNF